MGEPLTIDITPKWAGLLDWAWRPTNEPELGVKAEIMRLCRIADGEDPELEIRKRGIAHYLPGDAPLFMVTVEDVETQVGGNISGEHDYWRRVLAHGLDWIAIVDNEHREDPEA